MASPYSHQILVLREPSSSMDLAFMVTVIAISMGLVVAIPVVSHPLTAINSISWQATNLLSQIYSSFLYHLLNLITFTVQTSLNLLKHIIAGFYGSVAQLAGHFQSIIDELITKWIANPLSNLFRSAASHLLDLSKKAISKSVSSLFYSLNKVPEKLLGDVASNPEGVSAATSIMYNSLASIASGFVNALKDQAAHMLKTAISFVYEFAGENLEEFIERIEELFENWKSKLESMKETVSAISSFVSFLRGVMPPGFGMAVSAAGIFAPAYYFELVHGVWDAVRSALSILKQL